MTNSYYVGFRTKYGARSIVMLGPFETYELAKTNKDRAHAKDVELTAPIFAASKEDALRHAESEFARLNNDSEA